MTYSVSCKLKIAVLYLQWAKRTGKQKQPERVAIFLLQKSIMNYERQLGSNERMKKELWFKKICYKGHINDWKSLL